MNFPRTETDTERPEPREGGPSVCAPTAPKQGRLLPPPARPPAAPAELCRSLFFCLLWRTQHNIYCFSIVFSSIIFNLIAGGGRASPGLLPPAPQEPTAGDYLLRAVWLAAIALGLVVLGGIFAWVCWIVERHSGQTGARR